MIDSYKLRIEGKVMIRKVIKESSRTQNSVLNLTTGIFGQLLLTVLRFVTRTVFISTLGKTYLGISGLFSDILSMLSLTEFGFDLAINYKLYKPLADHDEHRVRILMKFYKHAYRVVGSTMLLLGLCLIPFLPILIRDYDSLSVLKINATLVFLLYLCNSVSSYFFFAYRSAVLKANQKRYIIEIADSFFTLAMNITQICVLIFLKDFIIYTAIAIVFTFLKNLINAYISTRLFPQFFIKETDRLEKSEVLGLLKDCGALFVYRLNEVVLKATDNIVLSSFIGLKSVGLYSNYLIFYTTIKLFLGRLYTAITASVGNLFATEKSIEKRYNFFEFMNYVTIIFYGTAAIGIAVCANEMILVWIGDQYVLAQPVAILIGIEILFRGLQVNLSQIRNTSGVFRQMWYRPIISVLINIIVSVALVRIWGINGVLIGTISSILLTDFLFDPSLILKYSFKKIKPVSVYYKKNILYFLILIAIYYVNNFICKQFFTGYGWVSIIVHSIIVAITVPSIFIILFWNTSECKYFVQLIKRIFRKIINKIKNRIS